MRAGQSRPEVGGARLEIPAARDSSQPPSCCPAVWAPGGTQAPLAKPVKGTLAASVRVAPTDSGVAEGCKVGGGGGGASVRAPWDSQSQELNSLAETQASQRKGPVLWAGSPASSGNHCRGFS